MADGTWQMAHGTWQVTHGRWQMTAPIFAEAQFPFFALIFLGGQAGFSTVLTASAVSGSSPHKQARRSSWPLRAAFSSPVLLTSASPIHLVFRLFPPDRITLLPTGEGAAQRRMRADHPGVATLTRPSATLSQWERDTITLLPTGEGAAQRRMRADHPGVATLTRPSATLSQRERDTITLLPTGEGAAQRRMRADHPGVATLTRPSATLSQWERDTITLPG